MVADALLLDVGGFVVDGGEEIMQKDRRCEAKRASVGFWSVNNSDTYLI